MRGKILLLLCFPISFLGIPGMLPAVYAQEEEQAVKAIISGIADELPEEEDLSEWSEKLSFYKSHPVNLNSITVEQLKELIFLSPLQINNLLEHINTNGKLSDLLELQSIPAFDIATVEKLLPFVTLKPEAAYAHFNFRQALEKGNSELLMRYAQTLEEQKGYTDLPGSRYLGSPQKLLMKYRYTFSNWLSVSLLTKKDAGETFFKDDQKTGFDFLSASVSIKKVVWIDKLVLGDYSLQFGQGLTLWSGFSFGKGADVAGAAKKDGGLNAYTSGSEFSFFRGTAINFKIFKIIQITSFISLRNLDASLTEATENQFTLSNINVSGLHRTATEIANKGSLRQLFYGSAFQYISSRFTIGILATQSTYNHEFITGSPMYNKYNFTGMRLINAGIHYNYTLRNVYFFGEASKSLPGGIAVLNGIMASLAQQVSAVVLYRNYAKNYNNFYSQGLGEGANSNNEKGIYAGININPNRRWSLSCYLNTFQFPWLRYRIDAASAGYELMGQLVYQPNKSFKAQLRFKTKVTAQNTEEEFSFNSIEQVKKENYRLQIDWKISKKINAQSRTEIVQYRKDPFAAELGYLFYQDVEYKPLSSRINGNMRLAAFFTPSYNSRIYAYEDDVMYASGSGLYSGKGIRSYLNLKYRLTRKINLWIKYTLSVYGGQDKIGTGLDEIDGNKKSDFKAQLRYQF